MTFIPYSGEQTNNLNFCNPEESLVRRSFLILGSRQTFLIFETLRNLRFYVHSLFWGADKQSKFCNSEESSVRHSFLFSGEQTNDLNFCNSEESPVRRSFLILGSRQTILIFATLRNPRFDVHSLFWGADKQDYEYRASLTHIFYHKLVFSWFFFYF